MTNFSALGVGDHFVSSEGTIFKKTSQTHAVMVRDDGGSQYSEGQYYPFRPLEQVQWIAAPKEEATLSKHVVAIGNPFNSIKLHGPFDNPEAAESWGNSTGEPYEIITLEHPIK